MAVAERIADLPVAEDPGAVRDRVAAALARERGVVVALDDDPTGSQTVAGVPLLLRFGADDLDWALGQDSNVAFALLNTRALDEEAAVALARDVAARVVSAARGHGVTAKLVSRSDSTLRGHFPAETTAIAAGLRDAGAASIDGVVVCPAFPEAGRITVDGTHFVRRDDDLVPVGETEFARDPVFGYAESDLAEWVAARAGIDPGQVLRVTLSDIRLGGAPRVATLLARAEDGRFVVLDAAEPEDLDVVALGIAAAEARGRAFIYRTGPSFVSARAGRAVPAPLPEVPTAAGNVLVAVGSHTDLTTRQLDIAVHRHDLLVVELDVAAVADPAQREETLDATVAALGDALAVGDAALATSRTLATAASPAANVELKAAIASAVVEVVQRVVGQVRPGALIAKGGITSNDLAAKALGAGRATVLGQLFPGKVSVWRLEDGPYAGLPYVVFPGNVGDDRSLADAVARVKGEA